MLFCLRVLSERTPTIVKVFTDYCRNALNEMLVAEEEEQATYQKAKQKTSTKIQPDDPIPFIQLQTDKSGNFMIKIFHKIILKNLLIIYQTCEKARISYN